MRFQILPETQTPEPVSQELREIIGRQIGLMSRLVDDLLDISRIARGQIGLAREPCDFAAIARQTVDDYRAILESNGLELTLDVPSHPVWVEVIAPDWRIDQQSPAKRRQIYQAPGIR